MRDFDTTAIPQEIPRFSTEDLKQRQPFVIADFMRPYPGQNNAQCSMQNAITDRVFAWLQPALNAVFERPAISGFWDEENADSLPALEIYKNHDLDASTIGWIKSYRASPTATDMDVLAPFFEGRFVVGFELSPFIRSILDNLYVPYVSLAIHPLRFMRDYVFMFASNFGAEQQVSDFQIDPGEIQFAAQLKQALMRQKYPFDLPNQGAVLFGQVGIDAALIGEKGVVSLADRFDAVSDLVSKHEQVYFKPHPYGPNAAEQVKLLQQFPNVSFVTDNAYALMACPQIATVSALTSSVLSEARVFGKAVTPLTSLWRDQSQEPAFGLEVLSSGFWQRLLGQEQLPAVRVSTTDVTIKELLAVSWETHGQAQITSTGQEIPFDTKMPFGQQTKADEFCAGTGWFPASKDHRWAGARDAFLSFRLPPDLTSECTVRLVLNGMTKADQPVLFQIRSDGHVLTEKCLKNSSPVEIVFSLSPKHASALGDVTLELLCDHARSPKTVHGIPDTRPLGVCLRSVEVIAPYQGVHLPIGRTQKISELPTGTKGFVAEWHQIEPIGIWSKGRNSSFVVSVPDLPDEDLVLTLGNIRAFLSPVMQSNTLFVSVAGTQYVAQSFVKGQPGDISVGGCDICVPITREAIIDSEGEVPIELELLSSHSPKKAGHSADSRDLGIAIETLTLISGLTHAASQPKQHLCHVIGPMNIHTGLGVMARNSFDAIQVACIDEDISPSPAALNFNNSKHKDRDTNRIKFEQIGSDVNVFVGDVTRIAKMITQRGNGLLQGRYNICYGAWELEKLPTYLADTRYIDEYWGLSTFIADAAQSRMDVPVHAFPIPVELHFPDSLAPRHRFKIPEGKFTFLFTFSVDSTMARKNPDAVLDAFQIAFPDTTDPVCLVIKSMIRQASPANRKAFETFKKRVADDPRVVLVEETLSRDDNASLYLCCDAFVSLHRAEGFGLTMAEAMGYGKPTIGTGYSGNLDFMRPENACLVRFDRVWMDPKDYHNQRQQWAEPDVYDAARHMRRIYDDVVFREKIARAGKHTIYSEFSKLAVGKKLLNRLMQIKEQRT